MMTARQVAELLGVHENWVYDQAANGSLPSYKLGGTRRFDPEELRGWIADHRAPERRGAPGRRVRKPAAAADRRRAQDAKLPPQAAWPLDSGDGPQPQLFE